MAHSHHVHDKEYYLEQFWMIGTCGALGVVMILLWHYEVLSEILVSKFQFPVFCGGIGLLVLVAVRIVGVWFSVAQSKSRQNQAPDLGHNHNHSHTHGHEHERGHGGEHGLHGQLVAGRA